MNKPTCHYLFTATYSLVGQTKEYRTSTRKFEHEYLILAREAAFEYYHDFIHGMLLGQGLTQREADEATDRTVRKVIDRHIDPKTFSEITLLASEEKIKMPDYVGNEISIRLITENDEYIIHSIKKDSSDMPYPVSYIDLESEYAYYKENNYSTKDYLTTINYFDVDEYDEGFEETALGTHTILRTPFDWTGYDQKGWWEN